VRGIESLRTDRFGWPLRRFWLDLVWVGFALANLVAMALAPKWETVPFHFIWVSLTVLYGFRVWGQRVTAGLLTAVVLSTGTLLVHDVVHHAQPADELAEVPLMGAMFLAMVWHAQRRRTAMEDLRQVSDANLRLLHRERQFIQDASHELRTPITVALGHAELVERASRAPERAEDARIVVDELQRLRRLADRLLLLATSEDPDFLARSPVQVEQLLAETLQRWAPIGRRSILAVLLALGPLGPRPRRGGALPLLACPVGVAELLVQRRDPLVQAGCLLVGDDRKLSGRASPLSRTRRQRHPRQDLAGHLGHRALPGPGDAPQPLEGGRRIDQLARHQRPLGLLNHHAVLQGDLQLAGQAASHGHTAQMMTATRAMNRMGMKTHHQPIPATVVHPPHHGGHLPSVRRSQPSLQVA